MDVYGDHCLYRRVHQVEKACGEILDLLDQLVHLGERESEEEMELRVSKDIQVPVVKKDHQ